MALHERDPNPAFRSGVRASGLGEVWTHTHDDLKFTQFGWRCTTKESSYNDNTLIGNWNQERYEINKTLAPKPIPSQFAHYFETTACESYGPTTQGVGLDNSKRKLELRATAGKVSKAFPGHQPELDHELDKEQYTTFMTTSRCAYVDPQLRKTPLL